MAHERDSPDDLYPFAQAILRARLKEKGYRWSSHRIEDAEQELFLAGWQVWREKADIGLAKNRMVSRLANLFRDRRSEREHEPKASSDFLKPPGIDGGRLWDDDANRQWDVANVFCDHRSQPAEEAAYNEMLAAMPERQRKVVLLRSAGYSDQEVADELGISLRTVERELSQFRKEHRDDYHA